MNGKSMLFLLTSYTLVTAPFSLWSMQKKINQLLADPAIQKLLAAKKKAKEEDNKYKDLLRNIKAGSNEKIEE